MNTNVSESLQGEGGPSIAGKDTNLSSPPTLEGSTTSSYSTSDLPNSFPKNEEISQVELDTKPPVSAQRKVGKRIRVGDRQPVLTKKGPGRVVALKKGPMTLKLENGVTDAEDDRFETLSHNRKQELKLRYRNALQKVQHGEVICPQPAEPPQRLLIEGMLRVPREWNTEGVEVEKVTQFGVDSHADHCIITVDLLPKGFNLHKLPIKFGEQWFSVLFWVIDQGAIPYPLLGIDWQRHVRAIPDWDKQEFVLKPNDHEIRVPMVNQCTPVRTIEKIKLYPGEATFVQVDLP